MLLQENLVVADRFKLVKMIGQGGMGAVWQAVHISLDQPCAVKFIEGEMTNVADAHARFEREAKAAAQLRSPHVVQILDHGVWQGRPYIAMELLEGEDLGRLMLRSGGKLHPNQINMVVQQVCRALTKAHTAGIVHRDLKPDNIFLVADDDRQIVKILDFGVAKQTSQAIEGTNTKTGAMLGTPYYMSPEQAQGIKSVDARSDLWALAVIVYQCVTGERPFDSNALGDLLVKIIVQPVPIPSQVAQVPPEFDRWWAKAAERNPDKRYQTAKDFASSLAIALNVTALDTGGAVSPQTQQHLRGTAMMQQKSLPPAQQSKNASTNPNPNAAAANMSVAAQPPATQPTPQQQQQPQQAHHTAAFIATPQPHTVPQQQQQPSNQTPDGGMAMGRSPSPSRPPPGQPQAQQHNLGSSGNPVTFSGVEPPLTIPKKTPPPVVLAGMGAVLLIGIILISIVVVRRSSATTGTTSPTSSVSADIPTATTVASETPPPPPTESVAATDPKTPTSASAPTTTTTTTATTTTAPAVTADPPKIAIVPKTTASTPTKPAPSASGKKPPSMDDRKW